MYWGSFIDRSTLTFISILFGILHHGSNDRNLQLSGLSLIIQCARRRSDRMTASQAVTHKCDKPARTRSANDYQCSSFNCKFISSFRARHSIVALHGDVAGSILFFFLLFVPFLFFPCCLAAVAIRLQRLIYFFFRDEVATSFFFKCFGIFSLRFSRLASLTACLCC